MALLVVVVRSIELLQFTISLRTVREAELVTDDGCPFSRTIPSLHLVFLLQLFPGLNHICQIVPKLLVFVTPSLLVASSLLVFLKALYLVLLSSLLSLMIFLQSYLLIL